MPVDTTALSYQPALRQAFVQALDPQGEVAKVFARELRAAQPDFTESAAQESAGDTLARRRAEQQKASSPDKPGLYPGGLPDGKIEELIEWLAQPKEGENATADAPIHIHKTLLAQRDLHAALADGVFRPGGSFELALATALHQGASELPEDMTRRAAADFVAVRRERAQGVTDALAPGGEVERKAIALAIKLRSQGGRVRTEAELAVDEFGKDISFGLGQTFFCWATDFLDPFICKWFMDQHQDHHHHGTLAHAWGGEIIGDTAAFFAYLGVRRFLPQPVEWLKDAARTAGDGFFERTGRKSLKVWAEDHHVPVDSGAYQKKLEEWKEFQADNFAKSSVISVSSVVLNVATQKAMGNTHKLSVITGGKLIGAAVTMAGMLGLRYVIPKTMEQVDEELSDRYFAPLIRKTQRLFGARENEASAAQKDEPVVPQPVGNYTVQQKHKEPLAAPAP